MAALLATTTAVPLVLGGYAAAASASAEAPEAPPAPAAAAASVEAPEPPEPLVAAAPPQLAELVPTATSTDDPDPQSPITLTVTAPELDGFLWYGETIKVTARAVSRIGSDTTVRWSTSGAQTGSGESAGGAVIPITANGATTVTVEAFDDEGNGAEPVSRTFKVDTTVANMTLITPSRPVYRLGETVVLQYSCDDPESGIASCGGTILDGSARPNGTEVVLDTLGTFASHVYSKNGAGVFATSADHTFRVIADEDVAPTVEVQAPPAANGWWSGPITVGLLGQDGDGSGVTRIEYRTFDGGVPGAWVSVPGAYATFPTAGEGDNRYQVRAVDWFGNVGAAQTVSFPTDATPPAVTVSLPDAGVTVERGEELVLDFGCTDARSGIEVCEAPVADGAALDTSELGTFEVLVRAVDAAGNETRVVRSYTVAEADADGPTVDFRAKAPEASGWHFFGPDVTVTASDASEMDIIGWQIVTASGVYTTGSRSRVDELVVAGHDFPQGVSTLRVHAVDVHGNATDAEFLVRVDGDAPNVEVTSPSGVTRFEQGQVVPFAFSCTDDASGVERCESSVGATIPTSALGEQLVTITAVDVAGQTTTVELAYTIVPAVGPAPGGGTTTGGAPVLASTGAGSPALWAVLALGLLVVGGVAIGSVSVVRRGR